MHYNPRRHHRRSIRLPGYDYTRAGAYFVTICSHERAPLFGDVRAGVFSPSDIGRIVALCLCAMPRHFSNLTLDAWVLMPDHIHVIFVLSGERRPSQFSRDGTRPSSLNAVVQNFKSVSTRRSRKLRGVVHASIWQRNYYEHIIRHPHALRRIRRYIAQNLARYPSA